MRYDKAHKALLEAYEQVYAKLGVNFEKIDKVDNWFMNYEMLESEQQEVLDEVAKKFKLTKLEKSAVATSFILGCSPKIKKV